MNLYLQYQYLESLDKSVISQNIRIHPMGSFLHSCYLGHFAMLYSFLPLHRRLAPKKSLEVKEKYERKLVFQNQCIVMFGVFKGFLNHANYYNYLSVSMQAVIGQFSRLYFRYCMQNFCFQNVS